jgi:hypothetical protein
MGCTATLLEHHPQVTRTNKRDIEPGNIDMEHYYLVHAMIASASSLYMLVSPLDQAIFARNRAVASIPNPISTSLSANMS